MQFLPTEDMKKTAKRREAIYFNLERYGMSENLKREFRKIFIHEGELYADDFFGNFNISELAESVFCSAVFYNALSGRLIFCRISGKGVFGVNRRLFDAAVLSVAAAAENGSLLSFSLMGNYARIGLSKARKSIENDAALLLGGITFRELKKGAAAIFFPLSYGAEQKPAKIKTEHLWGRYSASSFFIE